jgi:hypothetical protein
MSTFGDKLKAYASTQNSAGFIQKNGVLISFGIMIILVICLISASNGSTGGFVFAYITAFINLGILGFLWYTNMKTVKAA